MNITLEWLMSQPFEIVGNGRETRFNCPNCDDTTKHLYVNADRSLWYCFKCGKGGKVQYQKLEPNLESYQYQVRFKNKFVGTGEVTLESKLRNETTVIKSLPANSTIIKMSTAYMYLWTRGITEEEIKTYDIRVSLDKSGPHRNSIIFPVYDTLDELDRDLEYFVCRKYDDSKPKYVNAPWSKGDTLFVTDIHQPTKHTPVIVEGIFDALAVARVGYTGIALLGKTATSQQLNRLANISTRFIIYLDNDALSHAVQLKLQLDALGSKASLIRQAKDAADLYLEDPKFLRGVIENARKH